MANQIPPQNMPSFYPTIKVNLIQNPSRFYASPIVGGITKFFMLIPVGIEYFAISIAYCVLLIINSFVVLFTGKYWKTCYNVTIGLMRYSLKISYFWRGLTNKYPGFDLKIDDAFSLDMPMPQKPNRLFAIPIFGAVVRLMLLIPYMIYTTVIFSSSLSAANIATVLSSFIVFFKGKYPETTFELNRDGVRLSLALTAYFSGLSDKYPNFWISMNHKNMKIFLIILGILSLVLNYSNTGRKTLQRNYYQPQNQQQKTY